LDVLFAGPPGLPRQDLITRGIAVVRALERVVRRVEGQVEKERLVFVAGDEVDRFGGDDLGHIAGVGNRLLAAPQGGIVQPGARPCRNAGCASRCGCEKESTLPATTPVNASSPNPVGKRSLG